MGYPGPNSTEDQHKAYSDMMRNLPNDQSIDIDLVFIDGRFSVACCLKCLDLIRDDTLIIFDDFLNRPHYHIVLDYYDIIERTSDNKMVILRKKEGIEYIPEDLIKKYELVRD